MAKVLEDENECKGVKMNENQDIYYENKNDESNYSENGSIIGIYGAIPKYITYADDQKDVTHVESIGNGSVSTITNKHQDFGYMSPTNEFETFDPAISNDDNYSYTKDAKIAKIERFCVDNRLKKYIKRFIDDECILEDFLQYSEHELIKYFKNDKRYNMSNEEFDRFRCAIEIERQRRKVANKNTKNIISADEIRVTLQANGPGFVVATAAGDALVEAPMAFQTLSQTMKGVFGSISIAGMVIPAGVGIGLFLIEVAYLSVCRSRRKITKAQYYKALRKSALSNTIVTACTIAGAGLGSLGGPIGMFIGSIAGLLVGLILGYKVSKNYDKWVEKEANAVDATILHYQAFKYFEYNMQKIQVKGYVNMNDLNKRYRKYALKYHPDRNINNNDINDKQIKINWTDLCRHYGVLKGLCERSQKNKNKILSNVAKLYNKNLSNVKKLPKSKKLKKSLSESDKKDGSSSMEPSLDTSLLTDLSIEHQ